MLGESVTMSDGLIVTVFSMLMVFLTLIVISFLIDALRAASTTKDKKPDVSSTVVDTTSEEIDGSSDNIDNNDEELVAVIAAAIASSMNVPISDVKIRNIKRIPQNTPIWAKVGRQEQIFNRL